MIASSHTFAVEFGEQMIVDNFQLVAFSDTCQYKVTKFGGLKETLLGGEGLVTEITGPGNVYIQTKNLREFVECFGLCWSLECGQESARGTSA